jgi:hypothetical protein
MMEPLPLGLENPGLLECTNHALRRILRLSPPDQISKIQDIYAVEIS